MSATDEDILQAAESAAATLLALCALIDWTHDVEGVRHQAVRVIDSVLLRALPDEPIGRA